MLFCNFYFVLMQHSFRGVSPGRKRACFRQGRPGGRFAVRSAKGLATYVHTSTFMTPLWPSEETSVASLAFWCHRGGDLPLDLQRVSTFPAHGSPPLRLPEDGEPVHLQSGGPGRRQLLLLCFKPCHREECLLQVHPPHPSASWRRSVGGSSVVESWHFLSVIFDVFYLFGSQVRENTQQTSGSNSLTPPPCWRLILPWSASLWESRFRFFFFF